MRSPNFSNLVRWSLLSSLVIAILLACRTADVFVSDGDARPTQVAANSKPRATATATRERPRATLMPFPTRDATEFVPTEFIPPTEPLPPTEPPLPEPTNPPAPTRIPQPTRTATASAPTETPAPTRCPQKYCVVFRGCQPDSGNTVIEGYVYNNGVPENGVAVRVAKEPGAYPLVDDFVSGNSAINPGQPDPNTPGYYILQIVAGAPREGNWWVFVIDVPRGTKQVSEAKLIHTNDDPFNPANCQRAFVDFVR